MIFVPVTYESASPEWMDRRSRHRIWLKNIHPYVFCKKYRKTHQMRKHGEFEIYFVDIEGLLFSFLETPLASLVS